MFSYFRDNVCTEMSRMYQDASDHLKIYMKKCLGLTRTPKYLAKRALRFNDQTEIAVYCSLLLHDAFLWQKFHLVEKYCHFWLRLSAFLSPIISQFPTTSQTPLARICQFSLNLGRSKSQKSL